MSHIEGQQDDDLHDEHGNHVRPEYKAPRERLPDTDGRASVTGPVVRGRDVERAEKAHRSAVTRYADHMAAHAQARRKEN